MKAQCVEWYIEYRIFRHVKTNFRAVYPGHQIPKKQTVINWYNKFKDTGSVTDRPRSGRPKISEEKVREISELYKIEPTSSIRQAAMQVGVCRESVRKVLKKKLKLYPYKLQIVHFLKPTDFDVRYKFAVEILNEIDIDPNFLNRIIFSDESIFHISAKVNTHNTRCWSSETPHRILQLERDSPKIMVWCAMTFQKILCYYIFTERTVTGNSYLDMIEQYAVPIMTDPTVLESDPNEAIFMQDGASPHYANIVRDYLDRVFPERWLGRGSRGQPWREWPARSPDLTPCDFFLWGHVKSIVYKVKIRDIPHLKERIKMALNTITPAMLGNTWRELEIRLDRCRGTMGRHTEMR